MGSAGRVLCLLQAAPSSTAALRKEPTSPPPFGTQAVGSVVAFTGGLLNHPRGIEQAWIRKLRSSGAAWPGVPGM